MSHQVTEQVDRRPIRSRNSRWANAAARSLAARDISPNAISVFGMTAAIAAGGLFYLTGRASALEGGFWVTGATLVLVRLLANMFDGMVAIELRKATRVGALYNEVPDRISDAAVLIGSGYAAGGCVELGYLAACVALFVAYVRSTARMAGAPSDFSGPMAKQQRMFAVILAAVYTGLAPSTWYFTWGPRQAWGPMAFALALVVVGGVFTAVLRLRRAARGLRNPPVGKPCTN
jgi:phosphatidylglycerophosphate synthase